MVLGSGQIPEEMESQGAGWTFLGVRDQPVGASEVVLDGSVSLSDILHGADMQNFVAPKFPG